LARFFVTNIFGIAIVTLRGLCSFRRCRVFFVLFLIKEPKSLV